MNRIALILASTAILLMAPVSNAAIYDVVAGDPINLTYGPPVFITVAVGESFTLNAVAPPTTARSGFTWRDPDIGIARFGGVILGYGQTLTTSKSVAGTSRITLTNSVNTGGRFYRTAITMVYITTVAP